MTSSADFDHFLITRFSVVFAHGQTPPDAEWLSRRLHLFEQTTVPSVDSQSTRRFTWLVFFDDRVDAAFRRRVEALAAGRFEPVWTSEFFGRTVVAEAISRRSRSPWLITSRVDNDDCLATDYIHAVHQLFDYQERLYVNFLRGFQQVASGHAYRYNALSNPFISLIERAGHDGTIRTVFDGRHYEAQALGDLLQVVTRPMWSQTIHESNMMNQIRGRLTTRRALKARVVNNITLQPDRGRVRFLASAVSHVATRTTQLWIRQPRFCKEWLRARIDILRGTHIKPQKAKRAAQ